MSEIVAESATGSLLAAYAAIDGDDAERDTLGLIEAALHRAAGEGILSTNEVLDDMTTTDLPFALLAHHRAVALEASGSLPPSASHEDRLKSRFAAVRRSLEAHKAFLAQMVDMEEVKGDDLEVWKEIELWDEEEDAMISTPSSLMPSTAGQRDAAAARERKIRNYKRQRAAEQRIAELDEGLDDAVRREDTAAEGPSTLLKLIGLRSKPAVADKVEEALRERWQLVLQRCVRASLESCSSLRDEATMLSVMVGREGFGDSAERSAGEAGDERVDPARRAGEGDRKGLSVVHLDKGVDGRVVERRERIKADIFRPYHNLPTMSLAEFADQEMREAMEREERQRNAPAPPRRTEHLERDGDEDDHALEEDGRRRQAEWDDWKDANPKGIGNKMGKRF